MRICQSTQSWKSFMNLVVLQHIISTLPGIWYWHNQGERKVSWQMKKKIPGIHKKFPLPTKLWFIVFWGLTIRAAERQNAAPVAFVAAYSSYSASKKCRSASAIAKRRGSRKSKGVPEIVQPPLQDRLRIQEKEINKFCHKTCDCAETFCSKGDNQIFCCPNQTIIIRKIMQPTKIKETPLSDATKCTNSIKHKDREWLPNINSSIFRMRRWGRSSVPRLVRLRIRYKTTM